MIKVGITGQAGFIGSHLYKTLQLDNKTFDLVSFEDSFFDDDSILSEWVSKCDVIVHLAAVNRHDKPEFIYSKNIELVDKLVVALEKTNSRAHILFSSSIQENRDNLYGNSKKAGRIRLTDWAKNNNASFTAFIIPNVFGPFGRPYYNSVVATFCHQLTHNKEPHVDVDSSISLIYVGQLIDIIKTRILFVAENYKNESLIESIEIPSAFDIKVSELLNNLTLIKTNYFNSGTIPDLDNNFTKYLFNTFLCYIDHKSFFPYKLVTNSDQRGTFSEILKINCGGQVSFSTTKEKVTRGNHFHTRKAERFIVIKGKAKISLRKIDSDEVLNFELDGDKPSFVDIPIWYTHNITNIGSGEVYTIFFINEFYNASDPDTYFVQV